MPLPLKLNLVDIKVKRLSENTSILDEDFREPVSIAKFSDPITVKGQINFYIGERGFGKLKSLIRNMTGDKEESLGHCLFRKTELDGKKVQLKIGDIITEVAGVPMELELDQVKYESPLQGKFLLVYAFFRERHDKRGSK